MQPRESPLSMRLRLGKAYLAGSAGIDDAMGQGAVGAGRGGIEAAGENGPGNAPAGEGAFVGRTVDAEGQPGNHGIAAEGEFQCETIGLPLSGAGGTPSAHDGRRREVGAGQASAPVENEGRVGDMGEVLGIIRIPEHGITDA